MRCAVPYALLTASLIVLPKNADADWQAVEVTRTYAITGKSGAELYASIGARGPKIGAVRTIAHTGFTLTWSRKYQAQGDACILASARPKLTITYTLPAPAEPLPATTHNHWQTFIAGVRDHEQVHGAMIKDLVRDIEAATVGLTVPGDPKCRKIRTELTRRLAKLSVAHQKRNSEFDRAELSPGGKIHQLILNLVNGD